MPIIGFNFDRIQVERTEGKIEGKLEVKNDLGIKKVEFEKSPIAGMGEIIKFSYEFSLKYEPNAGNIQINGSLLYTDEEKKLKDIVKAWKKDNKLNQELLQMLLNNVLYRCHIKSLVLAQEVNLPAHMNLPYLQKMTQDKNYIG